MPSGLSKSKLMSFRQCPKRLWLEKFRPDLAELDARQQASFATGHAVGEIARRLYDTGDGVMIEYDPGLSAAVQHTRAVLAQGTKSPVFEATFERDGLLVRVDVLDRSGPAPRIVEVKSSTKVKDEHIEDCAAQAWVMAASPAPPESVALAHIDNSFVYRGDGDYAGLLVEQDLTAEIAPLLDQVPVWVDAARAVLAGPEPEAAIGRRCSQPYECPFRDHCWPQTDYPLTGLPAIGARLDDLLASGHRDVRDLSANQLTAAQRRVWEAVRRGTPELLPGAREALGPLPYPRHYLDFETISLAIPRWAGTRPYQQLPFQWSLHVEHADGSLEHHEFLDLTGDFPARAAATALLEAAGSAGPVFMYTSFERTCLDTMAAFCPDLAGPLGQLADRLVDLAPLARANYYHPAMHGSWSIKALLPTIAPELDYSQLGEVQEGTAAQQVYVEAIGASTDAARRDAIRESLLAYCRHDTLAMVEVARFLEGRRA